MQNRAVIKYIGLFAVIYYFLSKSISTVIAITAMPMTGFYQILAIFVSGGLPAYIFMKENSRLFNKVEKRELIIGTFLCSIIIDLLNTNDVIGKISVMKLDYNFIVIQIFNLLWIICTFGPLSKSIYQRYH
jgi:hypothetical protein